MMDYNQDSPSENSRSEEYHWGTEVDLEELLEDGGAVTKNKEERVCCNLK